MEQTWNEVFSVDPSSGWLSNLVPLNREDRSLYSLSIIAADNGKPVFNSTAKVVVNLVDSNDNPSLFTQPAYSASGKYLVFYEFLSAHRLGKWNESASSTLKYRM